MRLLYYSTSGTAVDGHSILIRSMYDRVDAACKAAYEGGVRILIDAEWTAVAEVIWSAGTTRGMASDTAGDR